MRLKVFRGNIAHDFYRDVHDCKIKSITVTNGRIGCRHNKLYTITSEKRALSGLYKKRVCLEFSRSVSFNHPNIKRKLVDNHDSISKRMRFG